MWKRKTDKEENILESNEAKNENFLITDEDTKDIQFNSLEETHNKIETDEKNFKIWRFWTFKTIRNSLFWKSITSLKKKITKICMQWKYY